MEVERHFNDICGEAFLLDLLVVWRGIRVGLVLD